MSFDTASAVGRSSTAGLSRPPGPIDSVRTALESAERLAARIDGLSRRLVGSAPQADSDSSVPSSDGLLYEMSNHADRVLAIIGDAESAISRIERALP